MEYTEPKGIKENIETPIVPHSELDVDVVPKPNPENQYEKFIGFHDYQSGLFRELDFILKKQGNQALLQHLQSNPLPSFQEYVTSIKDSKPELYTRITYDLALNSNKENPFISKFNTLVTLCNSAPSGERAEEAYKNLVAFFAQFSNSIRDNLN